MCFSYMNQAIKVIKTILVPYNVRGLSDMTRILKQSL